MDHSHLFCVLFSSPENKALSRQLAQELQVTLLDNADATTPFRFHYEGTILHLSVYKDNALCGTLVVDFSSPSFSHRLNTSMRINQPLARAVGVKRGFRPLVCDLTAGLGTDGMVLAALGCRVTMVERCLPLYLLLRDGLRRAAEIDRLRAGVERIRIHHMDAARFIETTEPDYDTIYLDPMYPLVRKSARAKLHARLLRIVAGDDYDAPHLLQTALNSPVKRVVVKRGRTIAPLGSQTPAFAVTSKQLRYDVHINPACDTCPPD
jgi:16S rRNA (guanine1516-N2)-methyltransferase